MPIETEIKRCSYCGDEIDALPGLTDIKTCSACDAEASKHDDFRKEIEGEIDQAITLQDVIEIDKRIGEKRLADWPNAVIEPLFGKLRKKAREIAS